MDKIKTYKEFWPFYLSQHSNKNNRALHYVGTTIGLICLILLFTTGEIKWLPIGLVAGYFFAWIGHFIIEKNRPATFQYPLWSFISDWRMWYEAIVSVFKK